MELKKSVVAPGDWYESVAIDDRISLIREKHIATWLRCNMWHIRGRNTDLLIDSGMGLRPLRSEIELISDRPITVVSTHCHFDHMGGAHEFDCRLGHHLEAHIHQNPVDVDTAVGGFIRAETFLALPDRDFRYESYQVTPAPLTGYLDEGDVVDLGDRVLQIMHLPGHSPGSIALFDVKSKTLFSGDVIYDGELYDTVYHSDKLRYRESLTRLRELDVDTIHGGHYGSFGKTRFMRIIDDYLAGNGTIGDAGNWIDAQL
ncbi:MAG: glyoxylase-like metal-dependent hydrolase (beta-lactamase superfamily II) [Planctomycetota bacterium]